MDLSRLRGPSHEDAAPDLVLFGDTGGGSMDAAGRLDERGSPEVATVDQGAQTDRDIDGAPSFGVDAAVDELASGGRDGGVDSEGGAGGNETDGHAGMDENPDAGGREDADDGTPATPDSGADNRAADSDESGNNADNAGNAPTSDAADLAPATPETRGSDSIDSRAANDTRADAPSPDAPSGTVTCPATINGSLDPTDLTQIGRIDRVAPASICGSPKTFPGNATDSTSDHLYDVYHFVNMSSLPVCFNFTLTYPGNPLYAAAYTSFRPTNIAAGYLGDVGGALTSPQTMGVTVNAQGTIDVVVYAIAQGTAPAGSYALGCSTN